MREDERGEDEDERGGEAERTEERWKR
jgi:hypothetical protein